MKVAGPILRYGLYLFIGGWMFGLGVMVGRGTSPVTFDTVSFQERLKVIVHRIEEQAPVKEKVDLEFFDTLPKPVQHEVAAETISPPKEEVAPPKIETAPEPIPVKHSRKLATLGSQVADPEAEAKEAGKPDAAEAPPTRAASPALAEVKTAKVRKAIPSPEPPKTWTMGASSTEGGRYTIQVAAFKDFKDAMTQMSRLEKKGISSYQVKGEKAGQSWYRVRTGVFSDYTAAQNELAKLNQAGIDGMIIKRDE